MIYIYITKLGWILYSPTMFDVIFFHHQRNDLFPNKLRPLNSFDSTHTRMTY